MLISIEPGFEVEPGHRFYRFLASFTGFFSNSGFKPTGLGLFNEYKNSFTIKSIIKFNHSNLQRLYNLKIKLY